MSNEETEGEIAREAGRLGSGALEESATPPLVSMVCAWLAEGVRNMDVRDRTTRTSGRETGEDPTGLLGLIQRFGQGQRAGSLPGSGRDFTKEVRPPCSQDMGAGNRTFLQGEEHC